MDSPLEIKSYFFPHVVVTADPLYVEAENNTSPHYDIKVAVDRDDERDNYQVAVEIVSEPESEDKRQAYSVHLVGIGIFTVHPDWPDPEKLLRINGASIIYSAAREFLITITSRGPWESVHLPTFSFLKSYKEQLSASEKKPEVKKGQPQAKKRKKTTRAVSAKS